MNHNCYGRHEIRQRRLDTENKVIIEITEHKVITPFYNFQKCIVMGQRSAVDVS